MLRHLSLSPCSSGMLKMTTFLQGLPGQQLTPVAFSLTKGSPEAQAEALMSEASSKDLSRALETEMASGQSKDEASRKEKKPKGLSTIFNAFSKGWKKKGQSSPTEPEGLVEAPPTRMPTGSAAGPGRP